MDQLDVENQKLDAILKKAQEDAEYSESGARVSALDPDFIFILVFVAMAFDIVLAVLALLDVVTVGISWVIGIVVSIPPFLIIGFWHYVRLSNLSKAKQDARSKLDKITDEIQKQKNNLVAKKEAQKIAKESGKKVAKKIEKKTVKQATRVAGKKVAVLGSKTALKRGFIALLGTSLPIIGMIPFYTLWMLSTLKDK